MTTPIYMDNHATTRVDPRVVEAMLPFFTTEYGNAASRTHAFGWRAEEAVTAARIRVARAIHADPKEIHFTSGATESNNLALFGVAEAGRTRGDQIITGATEHNAVLDPLARLAERGLRVTILPVDRQGVVDPDAVRRSLTDRTLLVSLMFANNEVGTLHPIAAIGALCKEKGVLFHTDAAQAAGKVPIDVQELGVDLLSLSGHKLYGPKGIGALYVRRKNPRVILEPVLFGGGHERGLRPGTLNVPGIVGLGRALEIAVAEMPQESRRVGALRDRLQRGILDRLEEVRLNGHPTERLPNNLNLSFAYVEGESLLMALDDVAVSSGSACTSARKEPSHVLRAMGLSDAEAQTSIRFGLGRFNTEPEVDEVIERVVSAVTRLRAISPLYEMAHRTNDTNPTRRTLVP
ncbi:MAG TPA: IscS subfamily cysteine desulfurase [Candidatus Polarisedimenticolia bacterium]|nr:IscS subfamily cysteine desulfurase [Candidatus Polarisedimenticolia bacterium]